MRSYPIRTVVALAVFAIASCSTNELPAPVVEQVAGCDDLIHMKLDGGVIESAQLVAAGAPVGTEPGQPAIPAAAAFCRVKAVLTPTPRSSIKVEVWLPDRAAWNGKLLGAGNGGFGSNMSVPALTMRGGVAQGYASVGTDMGHHAANDVDGSWALNEPEKIIDYGYRANHLGAVTAKAVVRAYYANPLSASYFHGCSDGGREALMEAQRFPDDYDAIIAGAPASPWTRLVTSFAADHLAVFGDPASELKPQTLKLLQSSALAMCDKIDGLEDGLIDDPRACKFDPRALVCKLAGATDCLTQPQAEAAWKLYSGAKDPSGKPFFPGYAPGAEAVSGTWELWLTTEKAQHGKFATEYFRYLVHNDPTWTLAKFDFEKDYEAAKQRTRAVLDADNPDLSAFIGRGGKLIMYHGWQDAAIAPENTINYYEAVKAKNPAQVASSVRLFMAPGMSHCLAGPGPNTFDVLGALDKWRSGGPAPEQMIATKYDNDIFGYLGLPAKAQRTRPLCAYPSVARWTGSGSIDDAANFRCVEPGK